VIYSQAVAIERTGLSSKNTGFYTGFSKYTGYTGSTVSRVYRKRDLTN
jgi:hypothetical protein